VKPRDKLRTKGKRPGNSSKIRCFKSILDYKRVSDISSPVCGFQVLCTGAGNLFGVNLIF